MSYRLNRDVRDLIVAKLAAHYPACFFAEPRFRRPLKKDILADLHAAGFPFTSEETAEAVDWYKSHFSYRYAVQAGAKRVDLDGREAGTVTLAEQRNAESYIAKRKQETQAREVLPAFVHKPVALTTVVRDDPPHKVTVHPVVTAPKLSLIDARTVDAGKGDRQASTKKQDRKIKMSPPCPTCGATGRVIHTVQVEGGALLRTRQCLGEAPHIFQTKEISIAL
jgi:sRNA-binding protein